jgi:glycosyltransferase involved in cell wall biosynthesis
MGIEDMKTKSTLSVVLATFNEEANIEACLRSAQKIAQEIIIADGNSNDKTVEIAKKFNAIIINTSNKAMFHTNKQMAIDAATGDWILQLDADEVVDETLLQSIEQLLDNQHSPYDAFWLKRKNYFINGFLSKGGQYPDPVIRLFKRGKGNLPQADVHEQMAIDGKVGQLPGHLLHYNAPSFARYIQNANRYTSLTAQKLHQEKVTLSIKNDFYYLFYKPLYTCLLLFIRHRGYKDGFRGLAFALFSGLHFSLSYMKLGDLHRKKAQ